MKSPVIIIGIGEMGGVFARAFLRIGHPVFPVNRSDDVNLIAKEIPDPAIVLVAVAEKDLPEVLKNFPVAWKDKLAVLQNELLPNDWLQYEFKNPDVISVWFEKKKGRDAKVIIPTIAFGPRAQLIKTALASITIPVQVVADEQSLLFELVLKNLYILTTNIAGLETQGTVGELWGTHQDIAREVADEVIQLQEKLTAQDFNTEALINSMVDAFNGDLNHNCMGRSAPARLQRALELAKQHDLNLKKLNAISAQQRAN